MRTIIPAILSDEPDAFLVGSGAITNVVFVEDLALWLPLMAVSAWWLWHRQPWGHLVVGAFLTMLLLKSIGVACDQWFGATADPDTPFASIEAIPFFLGLALVGLIPLFFYHRNNHRNIDRDDTPAGRAAARGASHDVTLFGFAMGRPSDDTSRGHCPLAALVCGLCDEVEVAVVVQDGEVELFGGSGDEQVGDLAPALAALGEQALNLERATDVRWGGRDGLEAVERDDEIVPLCGVACGIADFEVGDRRAAKIAGESKGLHDLPDRGLAESLDDARVDQVLQRHASARSSRRA